MAAESACCFPVRLKGWEWQREQKQAASIEKLYRSYHSEGTIILEDYLLFHERQELLKRYYQRSEYQLKIKMLSEYYKYHVEMPLIFHAELAKTVQGYHEEKREAEFETVTRKMKEHQCEAVTARQRTNKPFSKIIRNIELSYFNFEKRDNKSRLKKLKSKSAANIFKEGSVSHRGNKPVTKDRPAEKETFKGSIYDAHYRKSINFSLESVQNMCRSKSRTQLQALDSKRLSKKCTCPTRCSDPKVKKEETKKEAKKQEKAEPLKELHLGSQNSRSVGNLLPKGNAKNPKHEMKPVFGSSGVKGELTGLKGMFQRVKAKRNARVH